jgi:hypothetical protein
MQSKHFHIFADIQIDGFIMHTQRNGGSNEHIEDTDIHANYTCSSCTTCTQAQMQVSD